MGVRSKGVAAAAGLMLGLLAVAPGAAAAGPTRYSLANGCYALKSQSLDRFVTRAGAAYAATAGDVAGAEPFRMQATDLGSYLLFGSARDFLAAGTGGTVGPAAAPGASSDWAVDGSGGAFTLTVPAGRLTASPGGALTVTDPKTAGDAGLFSFEPATGCAKYPEPELGVSGEPSKGKLPYQEVGGFLDAHLHMMAFEFLGGSAHCGRPWHRYGVTHAMVDCPDHGPGGTGAVLENALWGDPARTHDTTGWPTFKDWPHWRSLTHEGVYYKWMERAWRGGLRMFVNLLVDNAVLCEIYPIKRNSCNEMETIKLQYDDILEMQDYIDAQNGGPGKGWFRIVRSPAEARRVINSGKLAVVLGIETSKLFDCGVYNDVPECTAEDIDRELDRWYRLGVRGMELVNKFDNALSGVAGDGGQTGTVVNTGNRYETGRYWQFETCRGPGRDRPQTPTPGYDRDFLVGAAIQQFLPPGSAPVYPEPPHCNTRGLTMLGEHLLRGMMKRGMIIDPDHMSQVGRDQLLALAEAQHYSGVISSHSWSTEVDYPRIYRLGGVVTPYAGGSTGFVKAWRENKAMNKSRQFFGFGYGADMNGFGAQGPPRPGAEKNPVTYPFKSWDGKQTIQKQVSGERVYDINVDGVAHYGLYPDWIEDLRKIAGDQIVKDMSRGAEAYLQMWERATGVPSRGCRSARGRITSRGLFRVHLGMTPARLLRQAGQPATRQRAWGWCVQGKRNEGRRVTAVFTPAARVGLVGTDAFGHRSLRIERGNSDRRVRELARPFGRGVFVRRARGGARLVFGVRGGRVTFTAVASREAAESPRRLRSYLRLAGLR